MANSVDPDQVDLIDLAFNGPVNIIKVISSRSVYLTKFFLDRRTKRLTSTCAHSFARNLQLLFLNQRKGENGCRKDQSQRTLVGRASD